MSAKATKRATKSSKTRDFLHRVPASNLPADRLAKALETAMDHLRAYKSRQDDVVRGLGRVQAALGAGSLEAAKAAIEELLSRDLKQAKDRQDNHAFALDIAIKFIEKERNFAEGKAMNAFTDALSQIEVLVPEAFKKGEAEPALAAAAS